MRRAWTNKAAAALVLLFMAPAAVLLGTGLSAVSPAAGCTMTPKAMAAMGMGAHCDMPSHGTAACCRCQIRSAAAPLAIAQIPLLMPLDAFRLRAPGARRRAIAAHAATALAGFIPSLDRPPSLHSSAA
jgi:hypothetical protein